MHAFEALRQLLATQLGLGLTEFVALGHLYDEGPITARDLGQRLQLTSGRVTALLNRLEAIGYAERAGNPDDRRSVLIEICPAGVEAWDWVVLQTAAPIARAVRASEMTTKEAIRFFDLFAEHLETLGEQLA
jgi:DNA-binding MarR family transcriptional regulator